MSRATKDGRERLPSEQVENLRTNFAYTMSTTTPEPRLNAAAETAQISTRDSTQPPLRKRKRRMLSELGPHNESPEPVPEASTKTSQPINRGSSRPVLPKRRRNSKTRSELNDVQSSPDPNTDPEQEESRHTTPQSPQLAPVETPKKSKMLREIEAHNESPEQDPGLDMDLVRESTRGSLFTRSKHQNLVKALKNEPLTPRKDLNVVNLMLAELRGVQKGTKTIRFEYNKDIGSSSNQMQLESVEGTDVNIERNDGDEYLPKNTKSSGRRRSQPKSARRTAPKQSSITAESEERSQELAAESPWSTWDSKKGRIDKLLNKPRYSPRHSQHEMGAQHFEGAFDVKQGLHIFTPTAVDFSDFKRFLEDVEEVAGRKTGVVKVIVPSECLQQTPTTGMSTVPGSPVMKITKIDMSLNDPAAEEPFKAYNMLMTSDSTSLEPDELLHKIQSDKDKIARKRRMGAEAIGRDTVWKENHALSPYTEEKMIQCSEENDNAVLCALNEPATQGLRDALRCKNPRIKQLVGNRFGHSRSSEPGITEPVFHVATGAGPLSPLQMNKYAAYSLNYHHSGAPRILSVIRPEHHAGLEEAIYTEQNTGNLFLSRPSKPPTCTQFLGHQQLYVPRETLSHSGISYTEVVQNQGEMVITFPYAYHQAYTSGPNITEEMLYASDRCGIFYREKLYEHCDFDCAVGQPDPFDIGPVIFDTSSGGRSEGRNRPRGKPSRPAPSPSGQQDDDEDSEEAPHKRRRRRN